MTESPSQPKTIDRLFEAVYPSFALLAGMELDLFTPLDDRPPTVDEPAGATSVQASKLRPLLYALVVAGLLYVDDGRFANTTEASHYLVRGKPSYLGAMHEITAGNWGRILKTAATIHSGGPLERLDCHSLPQDELVAAFHP